MFDITVITPTLGRRSILRLLDSLQKQNVKILHLVMWDQKRCEDGILLNDPIFEKYHSENYKSYHYVISHPVYGISRVDNYLRSLGIVMATTNYITQIDDDCWLEEGWLSRAIQLIKEKEINYIFCQRNLWENEEIFLGIDNYESIGVKNKFGYHLMETNSIVFTKKIAFVIHKITYENNIYGHDRKIAEYLIENEKGIHDNQTSGLNQIVPYFLLEFHKYHISSNFSK